MIEKIRKTDIIGLGEVVIYWVTEIPYFSKPDEKVNAITESFFPGGVTANFLVSVARMGITCRFIGAVGDDSYEDFLIEDFQKSSIKNSKIRC